MPEEMGTPCGSVSLKAWVALKLPIASGKVKATPIERLQAQGEILHTTDWVVTPKGERIPFCRWVCGEVKKKVPEREVAEITESVLSQMLTIARRGVCKGETSEDLFLCAKNIIGTEILDRKFKQKLLIASGKVKATPIERQQAQEEILCIFPWVRYTIGDFISFSQWVEARCKKIKKQEVDDISAEVLETMWIAMQRDTFKASTRGKFLSYAKKVIRSKVADFYRKRNRWSEEDRKEYKEDLERQKVEEADLEEEYNDFVATLKQDKREIVELRKEGKSFQEIANILGRSQDAVKMQYSRILKKLKKEAHEARWVQPD